MSAQPKPVTYLEEQLRFEQLIAGLSTRFINLPGDQMDREIAAAQKVICETLGLDSSSLGQWDDAAKLFVVTHSWVSGPVSPSGSTEQDLPWIMATVLRGEIVRIVRISDLPEEAARDKETLTRLGAKSYLTLPLGAGRQVSGAISFVTLHTECEWSESLVGPLRVIADVIANALARKRSDEALLHSLRVEETARNSEKLFRTVANTAPILIWISGADKQRYFFNQSWLAFTGRTAQEEAGEGWSAGVHPDDHNHCLETYSMAFDARSEFEMEYRLRRFDGEYRWIVDRGAPYFEADGVFRGYVGSGIDITDRKRSEQSLLDLTERLTTANQLVESLKERLEHENIYLRNKITVEHSHNELVGQSEAIRQVLMSVEQVAVTDSAVLILGETGTGKELVARAIHQHSRRRGRLMVKVNCAALPATLVESELFGRERGAFTGALAREIGRFELANGSTILLDEIGELPLELQAKLLRVLQEGEFERLGSSKTIRVDARLIAATSRDLATAVKEGRFREDLYYRLNVFPIHVPPLRERREDIPMLTWHFLRELGGRMGREVESVRATTMKEFQGYSWPGNVRELRNVIERHLILDPGPVFAARLPKEDYASAVSGTTAEEVERNHIHRVLGSTDWRIRGQGGAAEILGLKPTTLESRMKKLGIVRQ